MNVLEDYRFSILNFEIMLNRKKETNKGLEGLRVLENLKGLQSLKDLEDFECLMGLDTLEEYQVLESSTSLEPKLYCVWRV